MSYTALVEAFRNTVERMWELFPTVAGTVLLLLVGWGVAWVLARVVRGLTDRVLARIASNDVAGVAIESSGTRGLAPRLFGGFVFWLVLLLFGAAAVEVLGLPVMTDLLGQFTAYFPNILAATLIALGGLVGARIARSAIATAAETADIAQAGVIANAVHTVILVMVLVIALEQLGVNGRVLELTLAVTLGSVLAAAALAFGLGARTSVANIIAARDVARFYRVGQAVRIDDFKGTVVQLSPTAVIVETTEGRVIVPASRFHEASSVLLSEDA